MFRSAVQVALAVALGSTPFVSNNTYAAQTPVTDTSVRGSLVIIGGNARDDNHAIWDRVVQLAGGKGARIAVFASAASNPERIGQNNVDTLKTFGANAFFVPVAVRMTAVDYKVAADDPVVAESVRTAGGAYFAGGDQARITRALRHPDGTNTLVLDALR